MLIIENFKKSYGNKEVIKNLSLEVAKGEIFGFIGHNGAGKTTTIKCIAGILDFNGGNITVDGVSIKDNPVDCKRKIAYLPDNPDLYENLTGIKYINFICDIFDVDNNNRGEKIDALAKDFEIYTKLGDTISSYSHGMKQKIAVIAALIHEPKLLILDEPFVGLDPKSSFILKEKMKQLCESGSSIFFTSHVLEVVEKLCHRVAILKDGDIIKMGNTNEIIKLKSLEEIFLESE
ncbi:MAG: ABC transporter ATP-binding protein [Anaerorhabdus sp.]